MRCPFEVRIIGSSHIKYVAKYVRESPRQFMPPIPVRLRPVSGLRLRNLQKYINEELTPSGRGFVVLQVGGNDVSGITDWKWSRYIKDAIELITTRYPGYTILWSDMPPRTRWRYKKAYVCVNHWDRLQRRARSLVTAAGGDAIRHKHGSVAALSPDGVHYSRAGYAFLWLSIQEAIWRKIYSY